MTKLIIVQHVAREDADEEDVKLIGLYTTEERARAAVRKLAGQAGFKDYPEGFYVEPIEVDHTDWTEGFVSIWYSDD